MWTRERVEAFSDGVLAIAITLLVLDLDVDLEKFADAPWTALGDEWPSYLAYLISFLTIGGVWMVHHAILASVGYLVVAFAAVFLPSQMGRLTLGPRHHR